MSRFLALLLLAGISSRLVGVEPTPTVDLSGYTPTCGVQVTRTDSALQLTWHTRAQQVGRLSLRTDGTQPLISRVELAQADGEFHTILTDLQPFYILTTGVRTQSKRTGWTVFFDSPYRKPYETDVSRLAPTRVRVTSVGASATVSYDGFSAGPFTGELTFTVHDFCALVHQEALVTTMRDNCAMIYDTGLTSANAGWKQLAWRDNRDALQHERGTGEARELANRLRAIVALGSFGALASFPPPHQFLYPLDEAENFGFNFAGANHRGLIRDPAFGVRQSIEGDRRHVPWNNARPGTLNRLGVFHLLSAGDATQVLAEVGAFTHDDTFVPLPGHKTFSSHYHNEHSTALRKAQEAQKTTEIPPAFVNPPFVEVFKTKGIDIVHLAEFHLGDAPKKWTADERLPRLKLLHDECRRLSDGKLLLLPGEEPNVHLGGHWLSFFPKPVYWVLNRPQGTPFTQEVPGYGTVYHVGNAEDVLTLMEKEQGLMWTAHPRIKASEAYPDEYRDKPFYRSERFLGGTWKAMPADLSLPRLGTRCLDLLNDMNNWGERKVIVGEADIFRIRPDFEIYGHLNINYLELDALPRFDQPWTPILEALRGGRFFVTTGEVLLTGVRIANRPMGTTATLPADGRVEVRAQVRWTFPPAYAEVVWGDGSTVHRHPVDLRSERAFGERELVIPVAMPTATWARLEVWDVAVNGAFTQPVWFK